MNLKEAVDQTSERVISLFKVGPETGKRPVHRESEGHVSKGADEGAGGSEETGIDLSGESLLIQKSTLP